MLEKVSQCGGEGERSGKARFKLSNHCSVFQAELVAIDKALEMAHRMAGGVGIYILSDSRSALEILADPASLPQSPI